MTHITEMVNKVRERDYFVLLLCFFGRRLLLDNALGDYPAKSGPITSLSPLISRSVSSWRTMLFHSIRSFSTTYSILYTFLLNLSARSRVRALSASPRFSSGFFPFNLLVFLPLRFHQQYQSPYFHPVIPPAPRILILDCNFGLFVSSPPWRSSVSTCSPPYLLFQSRTLYRSFLRGSARFPRPQFSGSSSSRRVLNLNLIPFFIHISFFLPFRRT